MIYSMHRRIAGFVTLLGLAVAATARPALAQEATSSDWFDGPDNSAPPAPADGEEQVPAYGPPGMAPVPDQSAPQAPQVTPEAPQDNAPETDARALTEFRPTLDPYGTWVEDQKYGTIWVPNRDAVGDDFAPYVSGGHWALTDDGDWTWQSDYPFGDVVFHYGRWVWVPGTGWAWVAGRRYANAWVDWRVPTDDYGYVGWAPMPPAWGWYGGSAVSLWWSPAAPYVFCPSIYAFSYHVNTYIVHDRYVIHDVAAHTRNYSYAAGGAHIAAAPRVLPANSPAPRGPTLQSAHIPASAAPASRIASSSSFSGARGSMSARGNVYARGDSSYGAPRPYGAPTYTSSRADSNPSGYSRSSYQRPSTNYSRPSSYPAYRTAPPRSYHPAPSTTRPSYYSAPSATRPSYYSAPSATRPSYYSAPSAAPRSYSTPVAGYSAPSVSYSASARSYSAPSASHSGPARSYSAPAFQSHSRR